MADKVTKTLQYKVDTAQMVSGLKKAKEAEIALGNEAVKADKHIVQGAKDSGKASDKLTKKVKKTGDAAEKSGNQAKAASGAFKAGFAAAAIGAAAVIAGVTKIIAGTNEWAGAINDVAKSAANVGATAEEYQVLEETLGRVTDGTVDTVKILDTLAKRTAEAGEGAGPAADAFRELGLSADTFGKLAPVDQLATLGDALAGMEDQERRALISSDLLGGAARSMGSAFKNGGDDIRAASTIVKENGVISNDAAAAAEMLVDANDNLSQAFGALKGEALEPLLPVLTDAADQLRSVIIEAQKSGDIDELASAFANLAESDLVPALVTTVELLTKAGPIIEGLVSVAEFYTAGLHNLSGAFKLLSGDVEGAVESFKEFGSIVWDAVTSEKETRQLTGQMRFFTEAVDDSRTSVGYMAEALGWSLDVQDQSIERLKAQSEAQVEVGRTAKAAGDAVVASYEAQTEGLEEMLGTAQELWENNSESVGEIWRADKDLYRQTVVAKMELNEDLKEQNKQIAFAYADQWQAASTAVTDLISTAVDAQIKAAENGSEAEKKAALKAFHANKFFALSQAAINTALAFTAALANTQGGVVAQIAGGIAAAAAGAVAIISIAAEQPPALHKGGMVDSVAHTGSYYPDEAVVKVLRQEAIVSPSGVNALGGPQGIADINRGMTPGGGQVNVALRFNSRLMDVATTDNISRRGALYGAIMETQPRVGRYSPAFK